MFMFSKFFPLSKWWSNAWLLCITQPQEFIGKTERERTELKSSLLLERFKIYVRSGVQTQESRIPPLRVLHMSLANPEEAMSHSSMMWTCTIMIITIQDMHSTHLHLVVVLIKQIQIKLYISSADCAWPKTVVNCHMHACAFYIMDWYRPLTPNMQE